MAVHSVTHLISLLNQQIDAQEDLNDYLAEAEALTQVAVTTEFFELSEPIIYNYLSLLSDIIAQARGAKSAIFKHTIETAVAIQQ